MLSKKDQNIFVAVWPLYCALKVTGMFPLSFDGTPKLGIFKTKWLDGFITVIAFLVLLSLNFINIFRLFKKTNEKSLVVNGWQVR